MIQCPAMNAQQRLLLDGTVSTLPSDIIENILWRLPTKEIVRTSILSKEWRYNWTKIPKVVFIERLFDKLTDENQLPLTGERRNTRRRCKFFNAIYQFLLVHQGPIVDFTFSTMPLVQYGHCVEIDQILLNLSRKNNVRKLCFSSLCELPSSIFSFHQLTHLYLSRCRINHLPTFNGFGSLTNLCLGYIEYIPKRTLMHILSNNRLLKSFTILTSGNNIAVHDGEYGTFNELFQCLPVIQHLTLCVWDIQYFYTGAVPREVVTTLVHLKYLSLEEMCLYENDWFRFLLLILRSSPNLEKLKLGRISEEERWKYDFNDDIDSVTMQDGLDIWLEHLIELDFAYFDGKKPDLDFVKLILAKSPILKKVILRVYDEDESLKLLEALLPSSCASPTVEIFGYWEN
ncbi:F-box/FBD/LRR-repeat protein At1g13570-like isoform X2 [Rutidosis leptorrhynchoides]|uniref:F-box/FBD/LRR-repeat protein At1g13570-like isoform X2 n=1 Tax=Rutidosis leptorrhynchoides TaxID=125765 RepID=UPI003A99F8B6